MLRTLYIWGAPKRAGAISSRIGTSYPQRAAWCCDAARAGGQVLRCSGILGWMFSELIALLVQLIARKLKIKFDYLYYL